MQLGSHTHTHTHTIGAMDHLPSNYSPFRQQLEGSWFRSHLNSSAWHTSFKCAVVCVDAHRSVCSLWVKTSQNCTSTLTVNTHRSVCVHCGSRRHRIARRRSRSTLTEVCVSTVGQDGTELHVDAHGQHSQKCVSTVGQDGTEFHVDAHGQHSQKFVCPLWVKTAQNCTSTLTVNTHRSVCVHCGSRRHAYGWSHTRHMGSKPDSVRSLGVSNRADHIKVVNTMSDVHGLWKYIAVCFHIGWTVLVPCTKLRNVRVHTSV